jgi:hypothetical protein
MSREDRRLEAEAEVVATVNESWKAGDRKRAD